MQKNKMTDYLELFLNIFLRFSTNGAGLFAFPDEKESQIYFL